MKKRFLVIAALIGLLASCRNPAEGSPDDHKNPVNPVNPKQETVIVFDNTQGICAAVVYNDDQRRDEDKIAEIPAGARSQEFEWTPGTSVVFYFTYRVNLKGISGFTLSYVPAVGKDRTVVPIGANTKTNIVIPKLDETLSSPDALLSNSSYLLIQNNSSYTFQLLRGDGIVLPDNFSNSLVTSGGRAQYTINAGGASAYRLLEIGGGYILFPGSLVSFEAGRVYSFTFNNSVLSLVSEVEMKLENVAGVSPNKPVPEAPGAPAVTAFDSLLTVRWMAVEGAESYEVYYSATQSPPALPERTVYTNVITLTGLKNRTPYYVWVKAANENGASDFSPRARGIPWPDGQSPDVPEMPVIIPGINQLTVNWEETGGAVSYEVYINTTPSTPSASVLTTDKTSAAITRLGNGNILENDGIYYIWVRAVNSAGRSGYSPLVSGSPRIPTIAPATPSRPVVAVGNKELSVSWPAVELTQAYEVWFGTIDNSAQAEKFGGDITGGVTEAIVTGLTNEQTYYVWIRAKNIIGTSDFSFSASAKPSAFAALPETPATPTVISGNRELAVSWQAVEGTLFYEVWTATTSNSANAEKYGADISGVSVTLNNLVNGTTYYIWVMAKNNAGESDFSPRASGTPSAFAATPPAPQAAPTISAGSGQLAVSWQAAEGASAYEVWAGTTDNPAEATKRGDDVAGLSAVITGLTNDTIYYIWIKAKNNAGESDFSPVANGTPSAFAVIPQAPAAPSIVSGNGQISVNWTAVEGTLAYEVWLGTSNNSAAAAKNGEDESELLSKTISGLSNGTTYYIWLKAKNDIGASGFSPVASGKPLGTPDAPMVTAGNERLLLTWESVAGAEQYEVYYGTDTAATLAVTTAGTEAAITGLTNDTTYLVRLRAKNSSGVSDYGPDASGTPSIFTPPFNPTAPTVVSGNRQLSITWQAVENTEAYEVWMAAADNTASAVQQGGDVTDSLAKSIDNLTNGTTYYVWIKAKNEFGDSGFSPSASGKPLGTPGTPTLTARDNQLQVSWSAVAGADQYEVYYGTTNAPTTLWTTTTGTTATITGLAYRTSYSVRLRAKNASGISDYGPSASATVGRQITVLMWERYGGNWYNGQFLSVKINGSNYTSMSARENNNPTTGRFYVAPGDVVRFDWTVDSIDRDYAFVVYYSDNPPNPAFDPSSGTTDTSRVLLSWRYRSSDYYFSYPPGPVIGSFTVPSEGSSGSSGTGTEANPISLTAGTWANGSITSTASGSAVWYSFNVTSGTTYYVWWNGGYSGYGDGTKTLDIYASAYYSSGTAIFTGINQGWTSPRSFTASTSGTVKIKVYPYSSGSTGTFAVAYRTSSTRP